MRMSFDRWTLSLSENVLKLKIHSSFEIMIDVNSHPVRDSAHKHKDDLFKGEIMN